MASTNPWDQTIPTNLPNMTGGLINNTISGSTTPAAPGTATTAGGDSYNAITTTPQASAYGFTGVTRTPDAKETVSGQLDTLLKSDNPLIAMGRTMAKQEMNKKGLLNSSMAIGAADAAAYQTALPIAQADAATQKSVADLNQNTQNQALQTNTAALNDASKTNLAAMTETAKMNLDSANKVTLAGIESDYKTLIQANTSVADYYSKIMQNITDISMSADLDTTAKTDAIATQTASLQTYLALQQKMTNLGYGDLLTFT